MLLIGCRTIQYKQGQFSILIFDTSLLTQMIKIDKHRHLRAIDQFILFYNNYKKKKFDEHSANDNLTKPGIFPAWQWRLLPTEQQKGVSDKYYLG